MTSLLGINNEPFNPVRWPAMGIHGDKSQQERDWVLNGKLIFAIFTRWLIRAFELLLNVFIMSDF